jgi:hypothetical protein
MKALDLKFVNFRLSLSEMKLPRLRRRILRRPMASAPIASAPMASAPLPVRLRPQLRQFFSHVSAAIQDEAGMKSDTRNSEMDPFRGAELRILMETSKGR